MNPASPGRTIACRMRNSIDNFRTGADPQYPPAFTHCRPGAAPENFSFSENFSPAVAPGASGAEPRARVPIAASHPSGDRDEHTVGARPVVDEDRASGWPQHAPAVEGECRVSGMPQAGGRRIEGCARREGCRIGGEGHDPELPDAASGIGVQDQAHGGAFLHCDHARAVDFGCDPVEGAPGAHAGDGPGETRCRKRHQEGDEGEGGKELEEGIPEAGLHGKLLGRGCRSVLLASRVHTPGFCRRGRASRGRGVRPRGYDFGRFVRGRALSAPARGRGVVV